MATLCGYNGWANYATWNVAMHVNNNEFLYRAAVAYAEDTPVSSISYKDFIGSMYLFDKETSDGVAWMGDDLDYAGLDEMMLELAEGLD